MYKMVVIMVLVIVGGDQYRAAGDKTDECSFKCSEGGPDIRFPFTLDGEGGGGGGNHCGYPGGFVLHCTESKSLEIHLPNSVNLTVSHINYNSSVIQVYDPKGCLPKHLPNLNLYLSPFHYSKYYYDDYILFKCPTRIIDSYDKSDEIPCLGDPAGAYAVYAFTASTSVWFLSLQSCTKMYGLSSVPYPILFNTNYDNSINLTWSIPKCSTCISHGGSSGFKNGTKADIDCYGVPKQPSGFSRRNKIAGMIIGSSLLMEFLIALYIVYRRNKENKQKIEKFLEDYRSLKPARYSHGDLKRITNNFKDQVGEGGYGTVFKGRLSNETLVAVKVLGNSTAKGEEFINEMEIISQVHHVNVARLVGFCADGFRRALVYEFLPNGSLDKFTCPEDDQKPSFGWDKLQNIALGIAKGIEYLHQGCDQRILHFDIKPHNILLDQNFNPKIIDFGLAKLCAKEKSVVTMTNARGTMGYIAPEVYSRNFGKVSNKSDIYSFGMLLLEKVGGKKIDAETPEENENQVYLPEWIYERLARGEEVGDQFEKEGDEKIARKLAIIGFWCTQWNPIDRPSISVVVQMLEGGGDNLTLPPNPFGSMNSKSSNTRTNRRMFDSKLVVISESD